MGSVAARTRNKEVDNMFYHLDLFCYFTVLCPLRITCISVIGVKEGARKK